MGQSARQAKSKARYKNYEELRKEHEAAGSSNRKREILIPPGPRLGDKVVEADNISKGFGDQLLIEDLSFKLPRGGIVGVIGPNGAGKTTLFKMITGQESPDSGTFEVGETVAISNVDQMRDDLNPENTVWQEISGGAETLRIGSQELNSRAYCGSFGFRGAQQQQKVGTMSGGERNRVHLAKVLLKEGNLLLLDEPSNDLDVATLRALEVALEEFSGCAVIISHDRWFLDRIATHIIAFEGNSQVVWFEGNYQAYEDDKKRRLGEEADRPKRLKFKPLTR